MFARGFRHAARFAVAGTVGFAAVKTGASMLLLGGKEDGGDVNAHGARTHEYPPDPSKWAGEYACNRPDASSPAPRHSPAREYLHMTRSELTPPSPPTPSPSLPAGMVCFAPDAMCEAAPAAPRSPIEDTTTVGNKNKVFYTQLGNKRVLAPLAMEKEFDVVVVGGGIVGMATAREILKRYPKLRVAVLEKEREVAPHQSSHNSGVIHAGMYYVPGSVMARTCVRGAKLMYEYCEAKKLPHDRVGKLIVASNEKEHEQVTLLFDRGTKNGVQGLRVLNAEEVKKMEPNVAAFSALWSPNTGIVDYGVVTRSLANDILDTGRADIKLQFQVEDFKVNPEDGRVIIRGVEPGQPGPAKYVVAKNVITCAGFYADRVAQLAGGQPDPKIVTFRGTYYQMKAPFKDIVKTNVYPVPSGGGIPVGVHFTPTVNERRGHQMIIGPGACISFSREGYKITDFRLRDLWDFATNGGLWKFAVGNPRLSLGELYRDLNKAAFLKEAQKLVPTVTEDMVEESFTGVMAQVRQGGRARVCADPHSPNRVANVRLSTPSLSAHPARAGLRGRRQRRQGLHLRAQGAQRDDPERAQRPFPRVHRLPCDCGAGCGRRRAGLQLEEVNGAGLNGRRKGDEWGAREVGRVDRGEGWWRAGVRPCGFPLPPLSLRAPSRTCVFHPPPLPRMTFLLAPPIS
jgi:L-2-hydroxyglutarate oxidase LhgO